MPKEAGIHQKLKLLYLSRIFEEQTDENHTLTVYELMEILEANGVCANRKTLADDISLLSDFGMDIICVKKGKSNGYYLGERSFEITELKLLADAVSSARFITEKKSRKLLKKIEDLAGKFHGGEINRSVYVANRVKSENELIYIIVDTIQQAINQHKKIRFKYFDYSVSKHRSYRDGEHICSPYALTWNDGNYYLVAHYEKYPDTLCNFRVDRMEKAEILDDEAHSSDGFDLPGYMSTTFSMFSGKDYDVRLHFDEKLVNAVIDKFGSDVILVPDNNGGFTVNTKIKAGPTFYSWMFQFGTSAEIISPESIKKEFTEMISNVLNSYERKESADD